MSKYTTIPYTPKEDRTFRFYNGYKFMVRVPYVWKYNYQYIKNLIKCKTR